VATPIFLLGMVSLFTDVSSEMIQSILPLYIIEIGGTALALGIITGVTSALSNILKGISGWLSDKFNRRKPFVVTGYAISNLSKPFIGIIPSWQYVLGMKTIDRVGKGIRTSPRDALISFHALKKGKSFGLHRSLDTLGAVIGSLIASLLLFLGSSYTFIIFFSIIPGVIAIILLMPVKEVRLEDSASKFDEEKEVLDEKFSKSFFKLIVVLGVIEFASLDVAFLIIRAADFIPDEMVFLIPIFYLILNIVYALFSPLSGHISDKLGRKPVIVAGLSILLASCIILAFPFNVSMYSGILILIIFIMYGFYMAFVDPISRAYIADLVGKKKRGRAYGYYYLSIGLISMIETVIFGFIYDNFSFTWAFLYISLLLIICVIIFIFTDFTKIIAK